MGRIPRIDQLPSPIIEGLPSPEIVVPAPPVVDALIPPTVNVPSYQPPAYEPPQFTPGPVIPPFKPPVTAPPVTPQSEGETRELSDPNEGVEGAETVSEGAPQIRLGTRPEVDVPFVGQIPLPTTREAGLAGTSAVVATSMALAGKSLVNLLIKILKPIVKKVILKVKEKRGKAFTDYELQEYFEFEGKLPEEKQVVKQLESDKKSEKKRQLEEHLQRQRQHKH